MLRIEKTANLDHDLYKDAVAIREQVFVSEQGVPIELEMKGENGPCYYVGYIDDTPVVTARVVREECQWLIQRLAVIPEQRNKHFGTAIMQRIEQDAAVQHIKRIILHAQDDAEGFYQKLGYQIEGDGFREAELPHHIMIKNL